VKPHVKYRPQVGQLLVNLRQQGWLLGQRSESDEGYPFDLKDFGGAKHEGLIGGGCEEENRDIFYTFETNETME
jgi:hypothetical protein